MEMKAFEGYSYIDGGVCAAKGFQASGMYCGIKKAMAPDSNGGEIGSEKNDIALVAADTPVSYTHLTLPTICSV